MSQKRNGFTGNHVYDDESRGVAMLTVVQAVGVPRTVSAHQLDARVWPTKQRNGSAMIVHSDKQGDSYIVHVLHAAPKQQCSADAVKAVARACGLPLSCAKAIDAYGVITSPSSNYPGTPRAGTTKESRLGNGVVHR